MNCDVCDLYDELVKVDRQASENIHKNNKKRVVRALEPLLFRKREDAAKRSVAQRKKPL